MCKLFHKITGLVTILTSALVTTPVFADNDNCVQTTFFGEQCGEQGITTILNSVVDIMTAGIAVLAVVGIVISGVQYLTASGNEEQLKKSKRRIFEIIIGLAAYVVIYGLLKWLLPTFGTGN